MAFKRVLVALKEGVDHGPLTQAAAAAAPQAAVNLVTLVRVGTHEDEPDRVAAAESTLDRHAARLQDLGHDTSTEVRLLAVNAAHDLVEMADERGCDLIVIGLAKRSRVGKALLGSDAQRVLLSASCPVLSVQVS